MITIQTPKSDRELTIAIQKLINDYQERQIRAKEIKMDWINKIKKEFIIGDTIHIQSSNIEIARNTYEIIRFKINKVVVKDLKTNKNYLLNGHTIVKSSLTIKED